MSWISPHQILVQSLFTRSPQTATVTVTSNLGDRPENAYSYLDRGKTLSLERKYQEAIAEFDRSIALDPDSYYDIFQRGILHQELNRTAKARADFQKALALAKKAGNEKDMADVNARLQQLR